MAEKKPVESSKPAVVESKPVESALEVENRKLRSIVERLAPGSDAVTIDQMLEKHGNGFVNERGQMIPEKYKGTIRYRISQAHYRKGQYFEAGAVISVTDEIPSRTWTRLDETTALAAAEFGAVMKPEASNEPRLSDKLV